MLVINPLKLCGTFVRKTKLHDEGHGKTVLGLHMCPYQNSYGTNPHSGSSYRAVGLLNERGGIETRSLLKR